MLLIKKCNDSLLWYAGLVGQTVYHEPNVAWEADGFYKTRDLGGCLNIVRMEDAEVIEETSFTLEEHTWADVDVAYWRTCEKDSIEFENTRKNIFFSKEDVEAMAKHFGLI